MQGLSFARNAGCGLARSWPRLQVEMSAGPLKAAAQIFRPGKVLVLGSPDGCGLRQKANISSWCSNMLKAKMEAWPPFHYTACLKQNWPRVSLVFWGCNPRLQATCATLKPHVHRQDGQVGVGSCAHGHEGLCA